MIFKNHEVIECNMKMTGVCEEDARNRSKW